MAIRRYIAEFDTTITNAYKPNLVSRGTGSNMGEATNLEVFSIYAQASTSSIADSSGEAANRERSRFLVQFPTTNMATDRTAGTIPASGSVSWYLNLYNSRHTKTLPDNFTLEVQALSSSWQEGYGVDMEEYVDQTYDVEGANWVNRSGSTAWSSAGAGNLLSGGTQTYTFTGGTENMSIDISDIVEKWIGESWSNNGLRVKLVAAQEDSTARSYYTKTFYSRHTTKHFFRPNIEARWDSSLKDDSGNFYASSSLAPTADNQNTIFLYNSVRGKLVNIPGVSTAAIYVNLYQSTDGVPAGSALTLSDNTPATGSWVETGVYSANVTLDTTSSTVVPVWFKGAVQFHTGSEITIKDFSSPNYNQDNEYVTTMGNMKPTYCVDEVARFRLYVRQKDWSPTIYTVASNVYNTEIIPTAYWKLTRVKDDLTIFDWGTGSLNHTKLSYDASGSYFDLDMGLLEKGFSYSLKYLYKLDGNYREQSEVFKFRVE
jgi:hypothetical protein